MKITEYTKKDGSTVYRSSVYLGIDTVTGKKVKTTISGRTKRELKAKALQAQIDFEKDGSTVYKTVEIKTYAELVENWLEKYCHTVKKATLTIIKSRLNNYLLPAFGEYKLDKLTPPVIQKQVNQWAKEYNQLGKGYQGYPQLNSLNKRILKYAVSLQVIPFNPARDIIVPRRKEKEGQKLKYLDDDNLKKFLTYLEQLPNTYKNFYDTVLYKTLLATGLRIRECLALKWSDIDLQNGTLDVNKTLNCEKEVTTPKTKSSIRVIDLDNKTVLMLRLYKNRQAQVGREIGLTYEKVFSNSFDEYRDARALRSRLEKHLKLSDCPRLTFHAFRHTHASILLNAGLPYKEIQTRLGHSQISITMDTYSHLSKDNKKNATSFYEKAIEKLKSS
ncbi:tyrosine-type recombinase/integrase [Streptococcus pneumoniae]|uniref:tyrosine-type recombinase/integrase n=1 Tax=Streptococcus pneumoniae TaxID=1313 RepID=UPI000B591D90|nr:site-specific integrase [Streptococcus pneumoniae]SNL86346.1 phage integrase: site-specific recombinase [Streptococcus pneumoniae]